MPSRFYALFFVALALAVVAGYSIGREVSPVATSLAPAAEPSGSEDGTSTGETGAFVALPGEVLEDPGEGHFLTVRMDDGSEEVVLLDDFTTLIRPDGTQSIFTPGDVVASDSATFIGAYDLETGVMHVRTVMLR